MPPSAERPEDIDPALEARLRRALAEPAPPVAPPPARVWEAIQTELGGKFAAATPQQRSTRGVSRRALLGGLVGAFVAGGAVGAGATWLIQRGEATTPSEIEVDLAPLEDLADVRGRARLLRDGAALFLDIELETAVSNPTGYIEVWLINEDLTRMVTVGTFPPGQSVRLAIDPALIEQRYTIVDLSNEPFDDNPAHSGDTIVRSTQTL